MKRPEPIPEERFVPETPAAAGAETMPADWSEPEEAGNAPDGEPESETREDETSPRRKRLRPGQLLTGGILSHEQFTYRLPVIVYIVFLMLLYIANGFHMQSKRNRLDRIAEELKQLKTIAVTTSAVRMTQTRQSEIERLLETYKIPLTTHDTPPRTIAPATEDPR